MARRKYTWNAYHDLVPDGVTNTDGAIIYNEESIVYTLAADDFPEDYDVVSFIMEKVRGRDRGVPKTTEYFLDARSEPFFKMWFRFQPNDSETGAVYANIEYAEICVDPLRYQVNQLVHNLHTAEQLTYDYEDLDDLEEKLELNFGYEYDRKLRGIE